MRGRGGGGVFVALGLVGAVGAAAIYGVGGHLVVSGQLTSGTLEAAVIDGDAVSWLVVPDPSGGERPTRRQVPDATTFPGGEGIWFDDGVVYFTTKGDGRVQAVHTGDERFEVMHDPETSPDAPLQGVDNIIVTPHVGSRTNESVVRQGLRAANNIVNFLTGGTDYGQAHTC